MTALSLDDLRAEIETGWEARADLTTDTRGPIRTAVDEVIHLLDAGQVRVAQKIDGVWTTHQWLKQAILLSFRLSPNRVMRAGALGGEVGPWFDKVPGKFEGWDRAQFEAAGFRAAPDAVVRRGAYIAPGVVLMPSFVNIGAYVDSGTMVDTWAGPTIVEDGCFIGARSEGAEGVVVGEGSVLAMGVFITASTKIVDRKTGETHRGYVPPYSVVGMGAIPDPHGVGPSLSCAVILKTVDAQTRSKTSINELLRD